MRSARQATDQAVRVRRCRPAPSLLGTPAGRCAIRHQRARPPARPPLPGTVADHRGRRAPESPSICGRRLPSHPVPRNSMNRPTLVRALVALLAVALSTFFVVTKDPKLGLDLRGGTSITFETESTATTQATAENTGRTLEVLRRRVDSLGVSEPTLAQSGQRRILVELPGVQDAAQAAAVIGKTAQLTIHPVLAAQNPQPVPLPSVSAGPVTPASPGAAGAVNPPAGPAVSSAPVPGPKATTNGRALPQGLDAAAGRQGQAPSPVPVGPQLPASTGAASPVAVSPAPVGPEPRQPRRTPPRVRHPQPPRPRRRSTPRRRSRRSPTTTDCRSSSARPPSAVTASAMPASAPTRRPTPGASSPSTSRARAAGSGRP